MIDGVAGRFLSVMLPYKKHMAAPQVKILPALPNSFAISIQNSDFTDTIIFAFEHKMLKLGEKILTGDWYFERRLSKEGDLICNYLKKIL